MSVANDYGLDRGHPQGPRERVTGGGLAEDHGSPHYDREEGRSLWQGVPFRRT
jgi:hypothetical protein